MRQVCGADRRLRPCPPPSAINAGEGDGRIWRARPLSIGIALACIGAPSAQAHGFGQRYDLPLPLSLYLVGTAAAVAVSFVIVGLLVQQAPRSDAYPRIDLSRSIGRLIARPEIVLALRLSALALFVLTVAAGFWG